MVEAYLELVREEALHELCTARVFLHPDDLEQWQDNDPGFQRYLARLVELSDEADALGLQLPDNPPEVGRAREAKRRFLTWIDRATLMRDAAEVFFDCVLGFYALSWIVPS